MGFQTTVNLTQAPAVAGDFASDNPRSTVLAGPGGLVADALGVTVGKFAWVDRDDGVTTRTRATEARAPDGIVARETQALITTYLGEASNVIPSGFPVTVFRDGDFWAKLEGSTAATIGATVYTDYSDGAIVGAVPTGASATGAIGATFTATGSGVNLTVTSVTGLISIGDTISGTGVPSGTTIVSQTSGTTGGAGVYVTSVATTASAATVTAFGTVLDITAVGSGTLSVGDAVTGTGVPATAVIDSQISGATGGVGRYRISTPATAYAASTTITVVDGITTGWTFGTAAAVGELVKISK